MQFYQKRDSGMCFCEFCEVFKNTFLTEHLWVTASENRQRRLYGGVFLCQSSLEHSF